MEGKNTQYRGGGGGVCVRVSGRDGTDRCVRDTQNKKGGGCVYVRGRGATDVYKQMTPKGKKGGGVYVC